MTSTIVDVLGTSVELCAPGPVASEVARLTADLSPGAEPATRTLRLVALGERYRLLDGAGVVVDDVDPRVAAATMLWRLSAIAVGSPSHVVLHAAAVALDVAVLLPGTSGAGKSMLAAACVTDGFGYLTDEHAGVSVATGDVVPFARPIDLGARGLVPASVLRAGGIASPTGPGAVVFPQYDATGPAGAVALAPADTLLALCSHAANLGRLGAPGFVRLADLAARCPAAHVTYGHTDEALATVRDAPGMPAPRAAHDVVAVTPTTTTARFDDVAVVFDHRSGAVHHLNAAATFVWLRVGGDGAVGGPTNPATLPDAIERDAPPGLLRAGDVAATMARFAQVGLVDEPTGAVAATRS